jgi:hypothetical protein
VKRCATIALLSGACAVSPDRPPIARIRFDPTTIPARDAFATPVVLDGSASVSIDDPGAALDFAWQLLDDEAEADGDLDAPTLTVRFAGDRPPRIVLEVTTGGGLQGDVTRELALTVR